MFKPPAGLMTGKTTFLGDYDECLDVQADDEFKGQCTTVSSTNKIDLHDIAERVLKVALNTITLTPTLYKNLLKNNLSKF
jgi:hypothetical protein